MNPLSYMLCIIFVLAGCTSVDGPSTSDPRMLIRQAYSLAAAHGDSIWPGFNDAPFGVLLVESERERLFCHEGPANGFDDGGVDALLACALRVRPVQFPTDLAAAFPAVDGVPTVVIGTPAATGLTHDDWVLTLIHEHFHQMQYAWPGYYTGTQALGLSGGDNTGMWMLNYPFPYERPETKAQFRRLADLLIEALAARYKETFNDALAEYLAARESARATVSDADWRYFELQLWQEGVARWTENAIAAQSDRFATNAREGEATILNELAGLDLASQGRIAVYPVGAAEAMLLEHGGTAWRAAYWSEPFALGPQLMKLNARLSAN